MAAKQITQTISDPGTAPQRTDPDNFDSRADTMLLILSLWGAATTGELTVWAGQANDVATEVNTNAIAAAAASAAAVAASNATAYDSGATGGYDTGDVVYGTDGASYRAIQDQAEGAVQALTATAYWFKLSLNADAAGEFSKTQNFNATTLTDAASIAWDLESNQVAKVTLAGNRTLSNPTNMVDGATYILRVIQDATGSRTLAYGTNYLWPGGTAPTLTTDANAVDILTFVSDGTYMYGTSLLDFS